MTYKEDEASLIKPITKPELQDILEESDAHMPSNISIPTVRL
jgi:hypothetical protein